MVLLMEALRFIRRFMWAKAPSVRPTYGLIAALGAAAAWAIANLDEPGDVAQQLVGQLRTETQSEVRTRLYQALDNQDTSDPASPLPLIVSDGDTTARVAGMKPPRGKPRGIVFCSGPSFRA
jgi:hypothetical protein